jgi:hypothetical protein
MNRRDFLRRGAMAAVAVSVAPAAALSPIAVGAFGWWEVTWKTPDAFHYQMVPCDKNGDAWTPKGCDMRTMKAKYISPEEFAERMQNIYRLHFPIIRCDKNGTSVIEAP